MPLATTRLVLSPSSSSCRALIWKGGARGRICAAMLVSGLCVGDWVIADAVKHGVARLRPFNRFPDAHVLAGERQFQHAVLSCVELVFGDDHRVHFLPEEHLLHAAAGGARRLLAHLQRRPLSQRRAGRRGDGRRLWHGGGLVGQRPLAMGRPPLVPALARPAAIAHAANPANSIRHGPLARQSKRRRPSSPANDWLNLGFVLTALLLLVRLAFLAAGKIELSEDEAYQWIWSKHLALSYYSKPLLIACVQFLGTHLWGDNEFGVRFFSPVISAGLSLLLLRFLAREVNGRAAFFAVAILNVTPLMALGSMVMTIDPLSVLFWTAAMVAGWRAVQPGGTTRQWLWMGLWMGLGSLGKYTNLFQWVCWAVLSRPGRRRGRISGGADPGWPCCSRRSACCPS